jgi:hypothetical protein
MFNAPHPLPIAIGTLGREGRPDNFRAELYVKIMYEILVKVITLNQQRTSTLTYSNTSTL